MDLLSLIKEKLTNAVVDKISGFLGEHPDKIGAALNSAVPTVLGGIMQKTTTPEEAGKVMDILKEGGHTGEVLDDLSSLLGNFDKTQMLITIGSNIANHFLGDKTNNTVETLSAVSGIRKTSSSSLIGLSTPLVLGAIGKVVAKEGLGISGLMKLLGEQKEVVQKALPPALFNLLDIKNIVYTTTPVVTPQNELKGNSKSREEKESKSSFATWIPWILLGLLGLAALTYVGVFKTSFFSKRKDSSDSLAIAITEKMPAYDSTAALKNNVDTTRVSSKTIETPPTIEPVKKTVKLPETPLKKEAEELKKEPAEKVISKESGSFNEKFDGNSDTWVDLENVTFKSKSAEIGKSSGLDELVKYLKTHSKAKVKIGAYQDGNKQLSGDRSYAIREVLIEKGISEGRIQVTESPIGQSSDAKIAIKIR